MTIKIYPAEGNGAHVRSVVALSTEVADVRNIAETAAGGGVPEAPVDGELYGRKNSGWEAVHEVPVDNCTIGFFAYNDSATVGTPIVHTGGNTTILTNDGLGAQTLKTFRLTGVTDVWDAGNSRFDFQDLLVSDMIDIRMDISVTSTSPNQEVNVDLELGQGGFDYRIHYDQAFYKTAAAHPVNRYNGLYIGDENTRGNYGQFLFESDDDATIVVNGWYVKILRRG